MDGTVEEEAGVAELSVTATAATTAVAGFVDVCGRATATVFVPALAEETTTGPAATTTEACCVVETIAATTAVGTTTAALLLDGQTLQSVSYCVI